MSVVPSTLIQYHHERSYCVTVLHMTIGLDGHAVHHSGVYYLTLGRLSVFVPIRQVFPAPRRNIGLECLLGASPYPCITINLVAMPPLTVTLTGLTQPSQDRGQVRGYGMSVRPFPAFGDVLSPTFKGAADTPARPLPELDRPTGAPPG